MYKIIGSDQKEYGPVSGDQIRQWITEGRVNAQTRIRLANEENWRNLADIPEFTDAVKSNAPPLPAAHPIEPAKTSGMAISSLVLGILGLFTCGITALVGLILGIVSIIKIRNSHGKLGGFGIAIGGTAVSAVFLLLLPVFAAMLLPAFAKAKGKAQAIQCMNNLRQLSFAAHTYAGANDGKFPSAENWCEALQSRIGTERLFKCAAAARNSRCDYAINQRVAGIQMSRISAPERTVLFFESDAGWNASGGPELFPSPLRHGRAIAVAFADGHAEIVTESRLSELRWDP